MTIFLDEACVKSLVGMDDAIAATEEVFLNLGKGAVTNVPRVRVPLNDGTLRITAAVLNYCGYYGVKVSSTTVFGHNAGRVFCLYREQGGELCAIVQVFAMGALRTGAASGVATKYLANNNARVLGIIGSGRQARTQVEAICRVRQIEEVRVYSSNPANRNQFKDDLESKLRLKVTPVESAQAAVEGCDVVVTATTSTQPVLLGKWLSSGTHLNAIGANYEYRRELDSEAVKRAAVIATDDREQVQYESTDLAAPVKEGLLSWDRVRSLGDVVAGVTQGRTSPSDVTIFKSLGVAIEDVALAIRAFQRAQERGAGIQLPNLSG
jgi:alanine dehydrogenase